MSLRYPVSIGGIILALSVAGAEVPAASPDYSEWSAPQNVGPVVNSSSIDAGPALSKDGLTLYFHSNRPGGAGQTDLWVAQRARADLPWETPRNLGAIVNSAAFDNVPVLSRDEHWLFFHSDRPGGLGGFDLWAAYRAHVHDPFGWGEPLLLGTTINTPASEAGAAYFENDAGVPLLFFNSTRPGGFGGFDLYQVSLGPDGSSGTPIHIPELSSGSSDQRMAVRFDGLEVVITSDRAGTLGGLDLWVATRGSVDEPWSVPINLGTSVNGAANDQQAHLASDRETLLFSSDRPGGFGAQDLYVATRVKRTGTR